MKFIYRKRFDKRRSAKRTTIVTRRRLSCRTRPGSCRASPWSCLTRSPWRWGSSGNRLLTTNRIVLKSPTDLRTSSHNASNHPPFTAGRGLLEANGRCSDLIPRCLQSPVTARSASGLSLHEAGDWEPLELEEDPTWISWIHKQLVILIHRQQLWIVFASLHCLRIHTKHYFGVKADLLLKSCLYYWNS